jgi:hypothetical protein
MYAKMLIAGGVLALSVTLAGFAPAASAGGLFSATGAIIAIAGDEIYVGEAEGHIGGSGTVSIRSQKNPALTCTGDFTSSAALGGSGLLQCSDGNSAKFRFTRLSVYRGYGVASFPRGEMRFAYGFEPEEAGTYMKLPVGKKLMHNGSEVALTDR